MERFSRRGVLRLVAGTATAPAVTASTAKPAQAARTTPHTKETFRALVDAILPETPELAEELGPEYEAGGTTIGLDEYFVTFLNELVAAGLPGVGHVDNARLSEAIAAALDVAATELLARGENEEPPTAETGIAGGPFARLFHRDRIRTITLFEEKEFDTTALPGPLMEADAGLLAQLLVGFSPLVYYSEWEGYDDFTVPPSERAFEPHVTGWRQVGYPGIEDGYPALRGYLQLDGTDVIRLRMSPGEFRENDYDTSDYEEPYPEDGCSPKLPLLDDGTSIDFGGVLDE